MADVTADQMLDWFEQHPDALLIHRHDDKTHSYAYRNGFDAEREETVPVISADADEKPFLNVRLRSPVYSAWYPSLRECLSAAVRDPSAAPPWPSL